MKKRNLLTNIATLCITLLPLLSFAQPQDSVYITNNSNGWVTYNTIDSKSGMAHFHLFGDGYFSINRAASHKFEENSAGYDTRTWFIKPYDNNVPTERSVSTGSTGQGTGSNNKMRMLTQIDIKTSWAPAKDINHFFILVFENQQSSSDVDGCVEFHFNSSQISIDTSKIIRKSDWVDGQSLSSSSESGYDSELKWSFEDLSYGEQRVIYIPAAALNSAGTYITHLSKYKVNCSGSGGGGSTSSGSSLVYRYPHDPNFKIIDGCMKAGEAGYDLEYSYGFHNDGENYANNVYVTDTIEMPHLNPESAIVHSTKHEVAWFLHEINELKLDYIGIMLPGLEQADPYVFSYDETCSYGKINICTQPNLPEETCIKNRLSIVFDHEYPIYTEYAKICTVDECHQEPQACSRSEIEPEAVEEVNQLKVKVYPNPFGESFTVSIPSSQNSDALIQEALIDVTGKVIQQQYINNKKDVSFQQEIHTTAIPKGIYFLQVNYNDYIVTQKLVKQ